MTTHPASTSTIVVTLDTSMKQTRIDALAARSRRPRREAFLEEMEEVVPWSTLLSLIGPAYAEAGHGPAYKLETLLRVHLMQNWFGFSDQVMEGLLSETGPVRRFAGLTSKCLSPNQLSLLHFRHFLERHSLMPKIQERVNGHLCVKGLLLKRGRVLSA